MTPANDPSGVLRTFSRLLADGDADRAAALFTENARYDEPPHPPLIGREAIRTFLAHFAARHSDARFEVERAIVDPAGERLAAEWRWSYTRDADGERRLYEGMSFVELRGGLIASWRGFSAPVQS
jgi:limonene-1,2-epoxide hydrolase